MKSKYTVEVPFSKVKVGQWFECGEGQSASVYRKRDKKTANPAFGQEHHVYGFDSHQIVKVDA